MTVSLKFPAVPYTTSTVLGGTQFFNGFFLGNKMRGFNFRPLAAAVKHTETLVFCWPLVIASTLLEPIGANVAVVSGSM